MTGVMWISMSAPAGEAGRLSSIVMELDSAVRERGGKEKQISFIFHTFGALIGGAFPIFVTVLRWIFEVFRHK